MSQLDTDHADSLKSDVKHRAKPVAVIDIGSSSIRMEIAEIGDKGHVRQLESLTQAVTLGKDAFTKGYIDKSTTEQCVRVLRSYRRILNEYEIHKPNQVRVVATSAVREAENQLTFLDRIYIATGLQTELLDEADVSRVTYLGLQPLLSGEPTLATAKSLIVEVGGGNTDMLLLQDGEVAYAQTFRLGALRLRQMLETYRAPTGKVRKIMQTQIHRTVEQVQQQVPPDDAFALIALGGDVRFAASHLHPDRQFERLERLRVEELADLADQLLDMSVDELVRCHHLAYPDAETLGPALLTYVELAKAYHLDDLFVSGVSMRDGLIQEMVDREPWTEEFRTQVVRSATSLGRKYHFDEKHATHVAQLSRTLFKALQKEHQMGSRYESLLYVAAMLHEIGEFVSTRAYHKHSFYLIRNGELFGLSQFDLLLVALTARYHRRARPKPTHSGYADLNREGRSAVSKMAAILRVAKALDESHSQRINELTCTCEGERFLINIPGVADLSLEQLALRQTGDFFEEVFGMQVFLRST